MNYSLFVFLFVINAIGCNQIDFCSITCNDERYNQISQFYNWEIYPRENGNQYFMRYWQTIDDSKENKRESLFVIGIEKKHGSIQSTVPDIEDSIKVIFCQEQKIDTSEFQNHIHNLFKSFLSEEYNSIESWNNVYLISWKKYSIIYSGTDIIVNKTISNEYVKCKDNCYYKLKD